MKFYMLMRRWVGPQGRSKGWSVFEQLLRTVSCLILASQDVGIRGNDGTQ